MIFWRGEDGLKVEGYQVIKLTRDLFRLLQIIE